VKTCVKTAGLGSHIYISFTPGENPCDRPRTVKVEEGPKREKWRDGCGALVSLDSKLRKN
jgi:hypothetical protein